MIIDGNTINVNYGYTPMTEWAVNGAWFDGQWKARDTGTAYDVYKAKILFRGPETLIQTVEDTILSAHREGILSITLSEGEEIFGAEIDYTSPITAAVVEYGKVRRVNFPIVEFPITLRITSTPAFKSLTPSLSALTLKEWAYTNNSEWDIKANFSLDSTENIQDGEADPGVFETDFLQRQDDMANIRRYIMTTARNNSFTFPLSSYTSYPFGYRAGTGPFTVKIIDWKDLGRSRYSDWGLNIKFARVYT